MKDRKDRKFRKSGLTELGHVPWGTHICQLYKTQEDIYQIAVPFFKQGLSENEACIWVLPDSWMIKEAVGRLGDCVPRLGEYFSTGQLSILNHSEWYKNGDSFSVINNMDRWAQAESGALEAGFEGLRAAGTMDPLPEKYWRELIDYETVIDTAIRKRKMIALCSYAVSGLDISQIVEVISSHDTILVPGLEGWLAVGNSRAAKVRNMKMSGLNYADIGARLGVSKQRAEQILKGNRSNGKPRTDMLTASEAASVLNVHINTIRRWTNEGMIKSQRVGPRRDRRFKREDLDEFLLRQNSG